MFLKDAEGVEPGPGGEGQFLPEQPPTIATRAHPCWTQLHSPASCEAVGRAAVKTLIVSVPVV